MKNIKLLAVSLAFVSSNVLAAGYSTSSTSTSALATSYAGSVTGGHDISNMHINPAILSKFNKKQFITGLTYLDIDIDPQNETIKDSGHISGNSPSGEVGDAGLDQFVPNIYFATPIDKKNNIGVFINTPFGLGTEYNTEWVGVNLDNVTEIKTVNLGIKLSHKLTDNLAIGFGVNAQKMQFIKSLAHSTGNAVKFKSSDWGYGYSLGLNYDLYEKISLGMGYNSKVDHELNGTFQIPKLNFYNDAVLKIATPESATIGAKYNLNDKVNLMSDVTWTRWSRQRIADVNESGSNTDIITLTYNWHDTFMYSLGGDYQYNDNLLVRFGSAFETNASDNQYRTSDVPTGDVYWLNAGINYDLGNDLSVDASYVYQFYENVKVDNVDAETRSKNLNARYRTKVNLFSVAIKKNF